MPAPQIRKLFLFGRYSLAVLPPKKWLTELGLKRGDAIELELDKKRGRIIIRLNGDERLTASAVSPPTPNKTTKPPEDSDWEPIPSL